jgi:hypothetical protein
LSGVHGNDPDQDRERRLTLGVTDGDEAFVPEACEAACGFETSGGDEGEDRADVLSFR